MAGTLFIISAPSGAGKTSLVTKLIDRDSRIQASVSSTTRPKRDGEEDGVNYHFLSVEAFEQKIENGDFLEHANVFDNFYGTSKSDVETLLATEKDVILEIDWQGAQQVRTLMPDAISIFILPPSLKELERRLKGRGTDSEAVIQQRTQEAISEMQHYKEFDYLVINNNFDIALNELHSIFLANRQSLARQYAEHATMINEMTQVNA
ncbi:MAG: guanylate kinase [Hydrogenovibrio sp.]